MVTIRKEINQRLTLSGNADHLLSNLRGKAGIGYFSPKA